MKKLLLGFAFLLFFLPVSAEIVSQSSFQTLNLPGFENSAPNATQCRDFSLFKDSNKNTADFYTIVSLHVSFEPVASDDANATVFLNDDSEPLAVAKATEFRNNWWRIQLPNEKLREQSIFRVCLNNSSTTTKATALPDSLYGTYQMAEFKTDDFVKTVSNYSPLWGQEFSLTVSLHNSGSEKTNVHIQYEKPGISFKHLAFVKGDTTFDGPIQPGQTVSFSYSMKSTQVGTFTLPAAIVFFTNEFGEEEKIVSNYPIIEVKEPDIKVQAVVLNKATEKKLVPGKPVSLEVLLTNSGQFDLANIAVIFPEQNGLILNAQKNQTISLLKPGESKTIEFSIIPTQPGSFSVGCKLAYLDFGIKGSECDSTQLIVESNAFPVEYLGGIVLIVIALLVYLYFHYR